MIDRSRKGFTLVELLVVMVVLGIVVGLSIPMLRNISNANDNRQYKTYSQSVLSGSKMYVDSYEEDLFGREDYGCALITYDQLVEKRLVKDILLNDISCNSDRTLVKVVKFNGQVFYKTYLGCGPKSDGKVSKITYLYPDEEAPTEDTCSGPGGGNPIGGGGGGSNTISITATPDSTGKYNRKQKKSKVILESSLGVKTESLIYYAWSMGTDYSSITDWEQIDIEIPNKDKQMVNIKNAENVVIDSKDLLTPKGGTGDYYLLLRVDRLDNLAEVPWVNPDGTDSKYINFGPFKVDSTPPEFNDSTVISSNEKYNHLKPKLKLAATDNYTEEKDLRMCVSFDENTCKTTSAEVKKYEKYNKDKLLENINSKYDSSNHKVHVTVADLAGNTTHKEFDYQVAQRYTLTYDNNGGSGCSSKDVTFNSGTTVTWGDLCTPTRTGYMFKEWKTTNGDVVTKDTVVAGDLTVVAQWSVNQAKITYHVNGGAMASSHGSNYAIGSNGIVNRDNEIYVLKINYGSKLGSNGLLDYNNTSGLNITRAGYKIKAESVWNTKADGTGKSYDQSSQYLASDFCDLSESGCDITLYANWVPGKPDKPSVNNSSGGNWTNQDVKLTYTTGYPTGLVGKWYWHYGTDNYAVWDGVDGKDTFDYTYSKNTEMDKKLTVRVCNINASGPSDSDNCSDEVSTNIRIDTTKPNKVSMQAKMGSTTFNNNYQSGNLGVIVFPYEVGSSCNQGATWCGNGNDVYWKPSDDTGTYKSGIAYYEFSYDCYCYNPSNNGPRTGNIRCDLASRSNNLNNNCSRVNNKKIYPSSVTIGAETHIGTNYGPDDGKGFFAGHAGYWAGEGGYIGQSWEKFTMVAVDNAGNKSDPTYYRFIYCSKECTNSGWYHRDN